MKQFDDIFRETEDRLVIRITLLKNAMPPDEDLVKIHSAINHFFQRIEEVVKDSIPESAS